MRNGTSRVGGGQSGARRAGLLSLSLSLSLMTASISVAKSILWSDPETVAVRGGFTHSTASNYFYGQAQQRTGPQVAATTDTVYVTWERGEGDPDPDLWRQEVMVRARSLATGTWGIAESVSFPLATGSVDEDPVIAIGGPYVHVLFGRRDFSVIPNVQEVYHTARSLTGGDWTEPTPLGDGTTFERGASALTMAPDGNLIAVFSVGGDLVYRVAAATTTPPYTWTEAERFATSAYDRIHHAPTPEAPCESECWFVPLPSTAMSPWPVALATFSHNSTVSIVGTWFSDVFPPPCAKWYNFHDGVNCTETPTDSLCKYDPDCDTQAECISNPELCQNQQRCECNLDCGQRRIVHCGPLPGRDHAWLKTGVWDATEERYFWWGDPDLVEGTDVRVTPRPFEVDSAPVAACTNPCDQDLPSSVMEVIDAGHQPTFVHSDPTVAVVQRGSEIVVYAIFNEETGTSFGETATFHPVGGDVWARRFVLHADGTWDKEQELHVVSRSPWVLDETGPIGDDNHWPRAIGDPDGWIHLVYSRIDGTGMGGGGGGAVVPPETFWPGRPGRQVFYSRHWDLAPQDTDWGWEIPLSDPDSAAAFGSIARSSGTPEMFHVVWTEFDGAPGEELKVMYRSGKVLSGSVPAGTQATWDGVVLLDSDFTVEDTATLTITQGTTVYAQTPNDISVETPPDPGTELVDLIIRGRLTVEGTAVAPVVFAATRGSSEGEWGGITFELEGAYASGYGYVGCEEPLSSISNAEVRNGEYGIRIRDHCAPSLFGVSFEQIKNERHVMLDGTDVMIPLVVQGEEITGMGTWSLAKTRVVAADAALPEKDLVGGESGKVDLIVYGVLGTTGSTANGDSVYFDSEGQDAANGDDWGGILLASYGSSVLDYVDIGYAANPLFMSYPDFLTTIRNSRIHHFADTGIWIDHTTGSGAVVYNVTVERGTALDEGLGIVGIFLDGADEVNVLESSISLSGLNGGLGKGIHVMWGTTFCQTSPPQARSLVLQDNVVTGPGAVQGSHRGIRLERVCGAFDRQVDLIENLVEGWNLVALDLHETADIQVNCNTVKSCPRSVEVFRTVAGGPLRFWENEWEALTSSVSLYALRTNHVNSTDLGPAVQYNMGDNRLIVHQTATKFIVETDPGSGPPEGDVLNARQNYWYRHDGIMTRTLLTGPNPIKNRIDQVPGGSVDFSSFRTTDDPHTCDLPAAYKLRVTAELDGDAAVSTSVEGDLPRELSLDGPYPNPSRGEVRLSLAVPPDRTGRFEMDVFNVAGRRVARWEKDLSTPGRFVVAWQGLEPLGAGMYFMRVKGPSFVETRRVTIVK